MAVELAVVIVTAPETLALKSVSYADRARRDLHGRVEALFRV